MTRKGNRQHLQNKSPEAPQRDAKGRLLKGSTANPGGQPAWARAIREALQQSAPKAAAFLDDCLMGVPVKMLVDGVETQVSPDLPTRHKAAETILKFTVSLPKTEVEVSSPSPALERLRQASVEALIATLDHYEKPRE